LPEEDPDKALVNRCEIHIDPIIVLHIQTATSLIEGRDVPLKEILGMIEKILRQLSFDKREKKFYLHCRSKSKPP